MHYHKRFPYAPRLALQRCYMHVAFISTNALHSYGTMAIGVCQKAAFCPVGSITLTWQSYRPGVRPLKGILRRTGIAREVRERPSVTAAGGVWSTFTPSR